MKIRSKFYPLLALALASPAAIQAQTNIPLVTNTNPTEVTGGGNDFVSQILAGQTLYVGIPYAAGIWPGADATDYFEVSAFILSEGGSSTAAFNFFTATDNGTGLSAITPVAGVTAGTANVAASVAPAPSDPGNTSIAGVSAQLDYANLPGDPFVSTTGGYLWLGITNTGTNTLTYYTANPFGGGSPAPTYAFGAPFDTGAPTLAADTYTYNADTTLAAGNQNVHPYFNVTAVTVPEPDMAMMTALAGLGVIFWRRPRR